MSENHASSLEPKTGGSAPRRLASVYTAELTIGIGAALGLFLLLLWLLNLFLPVGAGFGDLVRAPQAAQLDDMRLGFDAPDGGPVAVLSAVRRKVRDMPPSSVVWVSSRPGISLSDRHAVQSYADSGASIHFGSRQWLEMDENSVIVVRKPHRVTGSLKRRSSVLFMGGSLRGRLATEHEDDIELEIIAAGGTIRAAGEGTGQADIALVVDSTRSALSVLEGTAEILWGDAVTRVPSGYMVTYEAGQGPGEPVPLPRPPRLLQPRDGAGYRYRHAPPQVTFEWRSSGDAREFRLQIAREPDFRVMIHDEPSAESSFVHGNLAAGVYYWRVFGQRGPVASPPTPARRLIVERDTVEPSLTVELPDGPLMHERLVVRGSTEPDCRVLIEGLAVPVDADGRFEHDLTLRHGYNFIVVQSIDATGNTAFRNRTILADLTSLESEP